MNIPLRFKYTLLLCTLPISLFSLHAEEEGPLLLAPASHLEEALIHVYQTNPRLLAERAALQVTDERVSQASAGFRPSVSANGGLGRQRAKAGGQDWQYGRAEAGSLVLDQPLFNGFGTLAQWRAAKARVEAGRARLLATEQQVLLDAINAYLSVVEGQRTLELNRQNLERLRSYQEGAATRLEAGDATKTDLAQAESGFAQAQANLAVAEANLETARATYERVVGLPALATEFPPLPEGLPAQVEEAEELARQVPELAQNQQEELAADYDIDSASAALWPSLSLRGSMGEQRSPDIGLARVRNDSVTLNLNIPLYQGGGEYSRIREAEVQHEKTHQNVLDATRFSVERARQAWANFHAAGLVIDAAHKTSEAGARALSGLETEQKQGLRTLQDVLYTQSGLLGAQLTELQAERNVRLQAYRLLAATGRLTAANLHLHTPIYDPTEHYDDVADRWAGF